MADDGAPKSAYELAMERLRRKDAEEGVTTRKLTDEEKAAIAEVRSLYDSKIAEQEILQAAAMKQLWGADPAEIAEVDRRFRREKERLASDRDAKIEKIRRGEAQISTYRCLDSFHPPYLQFATLKGDKMRSTTRLLVGAAFVIGFALGWAVKGDPVVVGAQAPAKPFMMQRVYTGTDGLSHVENIEL